VKGEQIAEKCISTSKRLIKRIEMFNVKLHFILLQLLNLEALDARKIYQTCGKEENDSLYLGDRPFEGGR
jgi:hypothetical protein